MNFGGAYKMATLKRKRKTDLDSPAMKKQKTNTSFTLDEFMADFPPMNVPMSIVNVPPLPSTVLTEEEMQAGSDRKPPLRSTFNITLPVRLNDQDHPAARNAPYDWMKKQYAHCIIPELGEQYDFGIESETFHVLRDLHNARVRIREGEFLPDYIVCSLASRWICLEEKDRPACDGYFANGEIFVAACLPISDNNDALRTFFENTYSVELSAAHYIPRSKYSVHFVGQPMVNEKREILRVHVCSVLIRNTRTGQVVHIDTGPPNSREDRARKAGKILKSWLEFQKEKRPEAKLGPINDSMPLILDVDKETHPSLRSIQAPVSASLFLRRRILNWGDVKAFKLQGKPSTRTMANYALKNISGWLGLKSSGTQGMARPKTKAPKFEEHYARGALLGRNQPAPISPRIASAKRGEAPLYNKEGSSDDGVSDDESSRAESEPLSSHESVDNDEDTVIADRPKDDYEMPDDQAPNDEMEIDHQRVAKSTKKVSFQLPDDVESDEEEPNDEEPNTGIPSKEPSHEEPNHEAPKDEQPRIITANEEFAVEEVAVGKIDNDGEAGDHKRTTTLLFQFEHEEGEGMTGM